MSITRHITLPCLLLFGVTGPATAQSAAPDTAEVRTAATAERSVRPDLATLSLTFSAVGKTPAEGGARLALRADTLRRALVALGIPRDSLVTGSRWRWWANRVEPQFRTECVRDPQRGCVNVTDTTYRVRESITVRISDLAKVGNVIDLALALGITEISNIEFVATDTRAPYADALREATSRAREQAEQIAQASSSRLGRVLVLSTSPEYSDSFGSQISTMSIRGESSSFGATVITAPSITVSATVYGRWQLLPRP